MFAKTDTCRLLADPEGPAARRYRHYDDFLDHNHRALELLAELELVDRGAGLATLASIRRRTAALVDEVRSMAEALNGLAQDRYKDLTPVLDEVSRSLAPLLEERRAPIEGPLILPFSDLAADGVLLAGAKAVNLARVRNELQMPAPDGFVVTTAAFDRFLRENRLLSRIEAMLARFDPDREEERNEKDCRRIREAIFQGRLPEELAEALDGAFRDLAARHDSSLAVAMRSSAVGEDSSASFAGQYTSLMPVGADRIAEAYKAVVASKYTVRAILYRLRYGLTDAATPMAVAAVAMIDPRASGVLYTVDPSRPGAGQSRIDAARGLGENVVGGAASPDVFRIDRRSFEVVERRISSDGGAGKDLSGPAVDDGAAVALARMGLALERHFGAPQDVEWALDAGGELSILQSRPLNMSESAETPAEPDLSGLERLFAAGQTASPGRVSGKAVLAGDGTTREAAADAILVARTAAPELAPLMGRVRGLITDLGGAASHLASVAREFNVPALMDTRQATERIQSGWEITLLADAGEVYLGGVPELTRKLPARAGVGDEERGPIGARLREILARISPLNLTDPAAPEFSPQGCRTLHDVVRFAHEKAMAEMFNLSDLAGGSVVSRKMSANIPLALHFIDLGGGLKPGLSDCDEILPEHIRCRPMTALWRGLSHPGITWSGAVDFSARNVMALMAGSIGPENRLPPSVDSYALLSKDYLNLSVKFGYHYANLDALASDDPGANVVALRFAGGAGTGSGKALRIAFLEGVLQRLGYATTVRGDLLQASLKGLDAGSMDGLLDQTGRLLASTRLLDLAIAGRDEVDERVERFFEGRYDFLDRSEARLPGFYASIGNWSETEADGGRVIVQDGSALAGTVSCTLHNALDRVLGGRYRGYLEKRQTLHYYPVAVQRNSLRGDGRIRVEVRIRSGCVDLAAGLAFGLTNVGNSLVLAVDAGAGEIQLLEFINNRRHFLQRKTIAVPIDRWLRLEAAVAGKKIRGAVDGRLCIDFRFRGMVSGYVGLWTKGETVADFRGLAADGPAEVGAE